MINPERLLSSLLKQGLKSGRRKRRSRSSGLGRLARGATGATVGMGVLGIAIAAFEHFTSKKASASTVNPAVSSPSAGSAPGTAGPPPPPLTGSAASPPPPPPPHVQPTASEAELLLKAMVAAASADGQIDADELKAIRRRVAEAGLSGEERDDLERRLSAPPSIDEILSAVDNPRLAVQVYAVTLAAIAVDTDAERAYLERLRTGLNLPEDVVARLHEEFDLEA